VVRYFRKFGDDRLLFGGREAYTADNPREISTTYPQADRRNLSGAGRCRDHPCLGRLGRHHHAAPALRARGDAGRHGGGRFSGHGVMLSNFTGKLYADHVNGGSEDLEVMRNLKVGPFPGGDRFRKPLLFLALTWYSLRDRF
jgi:gamma-glutamylputrescine oxidase